MDFPNRNYDNSTLFDYTFKYSSLVMISLYHTYESTPHLHYNREKKFPQSEFPRFTGSPETVDIKKIKDQSSRFGIAAYIQISIIGVPYIERRHVRFDVTPIGPPRCNRTQSARVYTSDGFPAFESQSQHQRFTSATGRFCIAHMLSCRIVSAVSGAAGLILVYRLRVGSVFGLDRGVTRNLFSLTIFFKLIYRR